MSWPFLPVSCRHSGIVVIPQILPHLVCLSVDTLHRKALTLHCIAACQGAYGIINSHRTLIMVCVFNVTVDLASKRADRPTRMSRLTARL